jgi:hypothetical protein
LSGLNRTVLGVVVVVAVVVVTVDVGGTHRPHSAGHAFQTNVFNGMSPLHVAAVTPSQW